MDDAGLKPALENAELLVDSNAKLLNPPILEGETTVVGQHCWKKEFERRGFKLFAYVNPENPKEKARIKYRNYSSIVNLDCFRNSISDAKLLQVAGVNEVLSRYRSTYPSFWEDLDIGPSSWLTCSQDKATAYYSSIEMMLHEIHHDLRNGNCLYISKDDHLNLKGKDADHP